MKSHNLNTRSYSVYDTLSSDIWCPVEGMDKYQIYVVFIS